jgi:hypothetical protein
MANADPTGSGLTVALNIPAHHVAFLRDTFTVVRDGLLGDLAEQAGRLCDPSRSRLKADVYARLLSALTVDKIVADADLLDVLAELARSIDEDNEYERVACEHEALWGLHSHLAAEVGEGGR